MPRAASMERRRLARSSVRSFSSRLGARRAPVSVPPWAASSKTVYLRATCGGAGAGMDGAGAGGRVCGLGGDCPVKSAGMSRRQAENPTRGLVQRIDGESAEELGVEVGGFLRHDLAGEGHLAQFG